jgi:ABC-type lipoprotein export system ATPase subunit
VQVNDASTALPNVSENACGAPFQQTDLIPNLTKLYQVQQHQVSDFEKCESLNENDLETLEHLTQNLSSLQE